MPWGALVLVLARSAGQATGCGCCPFCCYADSCGLGQGLSGVPSSHPATGPEPVPDGSGRLSDLTFASERPLAITRLSQWVWRFQLVRSAPPTGWARAAAFQRDLTAAHRLLAMAIPTTLPIGDLA